MESQFMPDTDVVERMWWDEYTELKNQTELTETQTGLIKTRVEKLKKSAAKFLKPKDKLTRVDNSTQTELEIRTESSIQAESASSSPVLPKCSPVKHNMVPVIEL